MRVFFKCSIPSCNLIFFLSAWWTFTLIIWQPNVNDGKVSREAEVQKTRVWGCCQQFCLQNLEASLQRRACKQTTNDTIDSKQVEIHWKLSWIRPANVLSCNNWHQNSILATFCFLSHLIHVFWNYSNDGKIFSINWTFYLRKKFWFLYRLVNCFCLLL